MSKYELIMSALRDSNIIPAFYKTISNGLFKKSSSMYDITMLRLLDRITDFT